MRKTLFLNLGKILLVSVFVFTFLFQGSTQTFGQTVSGCTSSGPYNTITGALCNTGTTGGCLPGYLFSSTTGKPCPAVSTTPSPTLPAGSLGTLSFVKDLLRIKWSYAYPQRIYGATVANNKFIFRGMGCLQNMANNGVGGGVWISSEDGFTITERDTCVDGGLERNMGLAGAFHGVTSSGNIWLNWGGDGFIKENYNAISEANHAVYYSKEGVPRSSSPLSLYNNNLIVLKNRIIAPNSSRDRSYHDLISLPDWKLIGAVAVPPEFPGLANFGGFGFGDFVVNYVDGTIFSVSQTGVLKKIKNLPSAEHIYKIGNTLAYSFDYSTTPAKLAVLEVNKSYVAGQQLAKNRKISVYKLSLGGVVLDKVINLPDDDAFPDVRGDYALNSFGIWGDYVVVGVNDRSYKFSELQLWKGGQKIQTLVIDNEAAPDHIMISKGGYVATSMNGSTFTYIGQVNEDGSPKTQAGTAAILYKITVPTSGTTPVPGTGGIPVGTNCNNASGSLADLCNQYKEILRQTCLVAPNIAICQNP